MFQCPIVHNVNALIGKLVNWINCWTCKVMIWEVFIMWIPLKLWKNCLGNEQETIVIWITSSDKFT